MFCKIKENLIANEEIYINDETASFVKIYFETGSLSGGNATITGIIKYADGSTIESSLVAISDDTLDIATEISTENKVYTIDTSGYTALKSSKNCVVTLYSERY